MLYAHYLVIRVFTWMFGWILIGVIWILGKMIGKVWRIKFPSKTHLPSGQRIITYDDGKSFIELTNKHGPSRRVPDTPQMRERLMQRKREKSLLRFFRRNRIN